MKKYPPVFIASGSMGLFFGLVLSKGEFSVGIGFALLFIGASFAGVRFSERWHQRLGLDRTDFHPALYLGVVTGGAGGAFWGSRSFLGPQLLDWLNPDLPKLDWAGPVGALFGFLIGCFLVSCLLITVPALLRFTHDKKGLEARVDVEPVKDD